MNIPFSTEAFARVLVEYNQTVWPMQIVLIGFAVCIMALALRGGARRSSLLAACLGLLWLWMGIAYHWAFFTRINQAAWGFGALFVAEGLLLLYEGVMARRLFVDLLSSHARWLAGALFAYALVLYPLLGHLLGHRYPQSPTFGLPCPTTIFTFAIFLAVDGPVRKRLLVIPLLWSVIGLGAAIHLGIYEDIGLLVAGLTATAILVVRERRGVEPRGARSARPRTSGGADRPGAESVSHPAGALTCRTRTAAPVAPCPYRVGIAASSP